MLLWWNLLTAVISFDIYDTYMYECQDIKSKQVQRTGCSSEAHLKEMAVKIDQDKLSDKFHWTTENFLWSID